MKAEWQTKTLGDVFDIERGGSPRPIDNFITDDSSGINWIKISDATASGKYIYKTKQKIKPEGAKRSRVVNEGDFILSNSMSFGRPYIMKTTGCIHDGWLVLREKMPHIDKDFFYHLLGSDLVYSQFDNSAAGSTVRNLNIELVKKVTVPLPPLPEQQRIASILDEAFEGVATATANAEKNLGNARELFKNHLQSVFNNAGERWQAKTLGELIKLQYGKPLPDEKRKADGKHPVYGANGEKDRTDEFYFDKPTIIVGRKGSAGEVNLTEEKFWPLDVTYFVDFDENELHLKFLYNLLATLDLPKLAKGVKPGINRNEVYSIVVKVPSFHEQQHIVAKLDELSAETKKLEAIYQQKLALLAELKKSILNRAFSGQLH